MLAATWTEQDWQGAGVDLSLGEIGPQVMRFTGNTS